MTPARPRPTSSPAATPSAYGLPLAVTRFANIYGGGDLNFSRLIPETTIAVLEGRPPLIRSDGSPERDFLHVDDAVSAYLAIADGARRRGREGRGLQRRRRAPALGPRGGRPDRRSGGDRDRARIPRQRHPRRRDRPPVRRLDQAARADRLAPRGRSRRRPAPDPRLVSRASSRLGHQSKSNTGATLTRCRGSPAKGQVTIPKAMRDELGLLPGAEVEFIPAEGEVRIRKSQASRRRGEEVVAPSAGSRQELHDDDRGSNEVDPGRGLGPGALEKRARDAR